MRILFVSKNPTIEDQRRNQLRDLSEKWSLKFLYSLSDAQNFIEYELIKKQGALDLIISDQLIEGVYANQWLDRIRFNISDTYSRRDFNLRELPTSIVLQNKSSLFEYYNNNWVQNYYANQSNEVLPISQYAEQVKNWRRQVLEEIYNLGIRLNSGVYEYNLLDIVKNGYRLHTKIISNNYKLFPRRLNYDWIFYDLDKTRWIIDEFIKQLKRSMNHKKGDEKLYHKFFNENSSFLKRDVYSKYHYEPKLYYNEDNYFEPDFILKPEMTFETDLSVLEVKLPHELIAKNKKFHPSLRAKFMDHLFQINDYKEYLEDEKYRKQINNTFGYIPKLVEYNILIGRNEHKDENEYIINKRMDEMKSSINIITYDDLLDAQIRYLERMELLKITH